MTRNSPRSEAQLASLRAMVVLRKRRLLRKKHGRDSINNNNEESCPICGHKARSVLLDMHLALEHGQTEKGSQKKMPSWDRSSARSCRHILYQSSLGCPLNTITMPRPKSEKLLKTGWSTQRLEKSNSRRSQSLWTCTSITEKIMEEDTPDKEWKSGLSNCA